VATQLAFGNWPDPRHSDVHANGNDADDPEDLSVVNTVVSEDDSKDLQFTLALVAFGDMQ